MQTQGSLQESDLAALLQTMQSERATGTLTLENGSDNCALYFLFGHLFHAAGPGGEGEDVVIRSLGWKSGSYHFDPRAKLPAEETIKASPAELIAAAEQPAEAEPATTAGWSAIAGGSEAVPTAATDDSAAADDTEAAAEPVAAETSVWSSAPAQPAAVPSPWSPAATVTAETAAAATDVDVWSPAATPAAAESTPAYTPAEYTPSVAVQPTSASVSAAASGSGSSAPDSAVAGGGASTGAPMGSLPIPDGSPQYEGLKSAFVDFPRLLRTLRSDGHTGYIRLQTGTSTGVLLFREGELIEAEAGARGSDHGEAAFQIFRRDMDTGHGVIDVIDLDGDTVTSLARLLTGPPLFTGLLGRFINFGSLLEYLSEEKLDGSVVVLDGSETGVILLRQGSILAAYSANAPKPLTNADAIAVLAAERPARIEVRGNDATRSPIDTEAALSRPY